MFNTIIMVKFFVALLVNQKFLESKKLQKFDSYTSWLQQNIVENLLNNSNQSLQTYNPSVRPTYETKMKIHNSSPPVIVETCIKLNFLTSVLESTMELRAQFTFIQQWLDKRLQFPTNTSMKFKHIHVSPTQRDLIWTPDTFFQNEKRATTHEIDQPNVSILIRSDGTVFYSKRLSITFACLMDLRNYPLDTQKCPIEFGSYAYTTNDIVYVWGEQPFRIKDKAATLSNFVVISFTNSSCATKTSTGEYSCLRIELTLKRTFSFFFLQLYIPSTMLVSVSWISYWIDWQATAGRVPLSIVTLLAVITQNHAINANLPTVSYIKAVDIWLGACILFVFSSLIEYAFVNFLGIRAKVKRTEKVESAVETNLPYYASTGINMFQLPSVLRKRATKKPLKFEIADLNFILNNYLADYSHPDLNQSSVKFNDLTYYMNSLKYQTRRIRLRFQQMIQKRNPAETIDRFSRVFFPVVFILFNFVYWITYWQ